jgi:hypothetical protein
MGRSPPLSAWCILRDGSGQAAGRTGPEASKLLFLPTMADGTFFYSVWGSHMTPLTLISHILCSHVQRAAIAILKKGMVFDCWVMDLANKPNWFLAA